MCGIVGKVSPPGWGPPDRQLLERMCAALEHRGPDSRGLFLDDGVGLGIQRLRVIDLLTGDQPIANEDGSIVTVLNGEIYNFKELRADLRRRGHVLSTEGDTEVIVHLYEEHGPDCVRYLHGMFAFALWDSRTRALLLARDRIGKKPLFYCLQGGQLSFASELRALIEDPDVPRSIDPSAIDCFLAYGYVPAPLSVFAGVRKLPPAHTLLVRDGRPEVTRYWRLDYSHKLKVNDPRELHEPVRDAIAAATRRRLVADVPLGAFLSGGVDSSAVVAAMAEASTGPVKTFSIGFESEQYDELPYARRIAQLFGAEHHGFVVRSDAISIVPKVVRQYGEPFADFSAIPCFYLAELTRRHVTVALNGDGGDECFGGYTRYVANRLAERLGRAPLLLRRLAAGGAGGHGTGNESRFANRARRLRATLALAPEARYARYVSWLDEPERASLYTSELRVLLGESQTSEVIARPWRDASGSHIVDRMLEVDSTTYLPGDLIPKIDIATMAFGLEARSPLLDHELMQFAASIPAELKVRAGQKKWILREALRGRIPDEILDRPKQGFVVPISDWFRGPLRDHLHEVLLDPSSLARGYFRPDAVRSLLARHAGGADAVAKQLWALYALELWHRQFVDCGATASELRPALA